MTVYEEWREGVERGENFKVNFKTRTLKLGKRYLIKDGEYEGELLSECEKDDVGKMIDDLFIDYKFSAPTERKYGNKPYFKALPYEEIGQDSLAFGVPRCIAQANLEGYVLMVAILGLIDYGNRWFYQSPIDKSLIIIKDWFGK